MNVRVLVTGAAGFVGSNLCRELLDKGYEVVGIDSITDYYDVGIKWDNVRVLKAEGLSFLQSDLNEVDFDSAVGPVDYVFHQAGQPGVRRSWGSEFLEYTQANVLATQKLLEWSKTNSRLKKFVYASSSSVYGDAESFPTYETDRPRPLSPYGVTKLAAEHLCSLYASNFGVPTVSLRYFTVYGPGQRPDMAFTRFVKAAVTSGRIEIYGDGNQVRDFTYVSDIVSANLQAAFAPTTSGVVYNVAGGSNVSVNEVLQMLTRISGTELNVEYVGAVAGDVRRTAGSIERISRDLQWRPEVGLEEGLTRHLAWGGKYFG